MEQRRIRLSDLIPGEPVPWDIFDAQHNLLVAEGTFLADGNQAAELVDQGAWAAAPPPSVLGMINQAHKRLEHLLFNVEHESNLPSQICDIAATLTAAADINQDVALASILLNQDEGTYAVRHCVDSAIVALLLARELDKLPSETLSIMAAALTMNVGMLQNQEQLQSRLNAISGDEKATIHAHPEAGVALLENAGVNDQEWLTCVLLHHENEDGGGYPFGKTGDDIPLAAKIVSLADRYCARVSARGYRKPLLANEALNDMLVADQQSIDPMLTACFIRVVGIYPTGAVVRLANDEIGVVAQQGPKATAPRVLALLGEQASRLAPPLLRDTANPSFQIREMLSGEQAGIRFTMQQVWGEQAAP